MDLPHLNLSWVRKDIPSLFSDSSVQYHIVIATVPIPFGSFLSLLYLIRINGHLDPDDVLRTPVEEGQEIVQALCVTE